MYQIFAEHEEIYGYIVRGDAAGAKAALKNHFMTFFDSAEKIRNNKDT